MNELKFVDNDISKLETSFKKGYEEIMGITIKDGDPINDFISWVTYIFSIANNNINFTGKMNLLKYATGEYLEAIGELVGVKRKLARGSQAKVKYIFSKTFEEVIIIPKRHKVAANNLYFELKENIELAIGTTEVIGDVICITEGIIGNNLQIGEINSIVDEIPYLQEVKNIEITHSGENKETDDNLRKRIRLKPTSYSTAGSVAAYKYHVITGEPNVVDVHIFTPETTPGIVKVIPLLKNGEIPNSTVLENINKIISSDEVRPLTDKVEVIAPAITNYSINIKWWLNKEEDASIIKPKINEAIEEYKKWQKEKLGRDINPNKLTQLLIQAGAKRIEIIEPTFIKVDRTNVAQESKVTITYQGVEDE